MQCKVTVDTLYMYMYAAVNLTQLRGKGVWSMVLETGGINPSSAAWAEAINNMFAKETRRDHD